MTRSAWLPATLAFATLIAAPAFAGDPTWAQIQSTTSWEHVSDRDQDEAGTVEVAVAQISGIRCLKGSITASGDAAVHLEVAVDIEGSLSWSTSGMTESEVLGTTADTIDYYQYLDVPGWTGASDRFWFLRGTKEDAGPVKSFWWERMGDAGGPYAERFSQVQAANPGAVEPPVNVGGWIFEQAGERVEIRYFICSDTGGSMPRAIAHAASTRTLPNAVGDLVREAKKRSQQIVGSGTGP